MAFNRNDVIDTTDLVTGDVMDPVHPGTILWEEFMEPLNLTAYALGARIGVHRNRITALIKGERSVTSDTALRFARYFTTTPEFWMNLQTQYDLQVWSDSHESEILDTIEPHQQAQNVQHA